MPILLFQCHLNPGTAFIESPSSDQTLNPVYDDPDTGLELQCIASGHERTIKWTKDGQDMPGDYFTVTNEILTEDGGFAYDQSEALKHTQIWIPPTGTCSDVNMHDGVYKCEAKVKIGEHLSTKCVQYTVSVECKCILSYYFLHLKL